VAPSGRNRDAVARLGKMLKKRYERFTPTHLLRSLMYLPLNLIPIVGPAVYLVALARRSGGTVHRRYFQLKGMGSRQREDWIQQKRAAYTSFGIPAVLLEMIPFAGIAFTFTNMVGAALWASDIEKSNKQARPPTHEEADFDEQETGVDYSASNREKEL